MASAVADRVMGDGGGGGRHKKRGHKGNLKRHPYKGSLRKGKRK